MFVLISIETNNCSLSQSKTTREKELAAIGRASIQGDWDLVDCTRPRQWQGAAERGYAEKRICNTAPFASGEPCCDDSVPVWKIVSNQKWSASDKNHHNFFAGFS